MSLLKSTLALLLGCCFIHLTSVSAKTYYIVTQTVNNTCPNENATCLTLTAFAQYSQRLPSNSNVTLIFVPGNHHLGENLRIRSITSLVLKLDSTTNVPPFSVIVVTCKNITGFIFEGISYISVISLKFNGCINNTVRYVDQFRMELCKFQTGHGIKIDTTANNTILRSSFISLNLEVGLAVNNSNVLISNCWFDRIMGGAIYALKTNMSVLNTNFTNNQCTRTSPYDFNPQECEGSSAMFAFDSNIDVHQSIFINNTAYGINIGSAIAAFNSSININGSEFIGNNGCAVGGEFRNINALSRCNFLNNSGGATSITALGGSEFTIMQCNFTNNHHADSGGAIFAQYDSDSVTKLNLYSERSVLAVSESVFINNSVHYNGGAIHILMISGVNYTPKSPELSLFYVTIVNCKFFGNRANNYGGAVYAYYYPVNNLHLETVSFINNSARGKGAAIYMKSATFTSSGLLNITNNVASSGVIFALDSMVIFSGQTVISNNNVSVYAFSTTLNFTKYILIFNNFINDAMIQEGGALTIFQSTATITGKFYIVHNAVYNGYGGAIVSIESNMILLSQGNMIISYNRAMSGGGVYAHQSELNFMGKAEIRSNIASKNGGGIYAVSSSIKLVDDTEGSNIYVGPYLTLTENKAEQGGGIYLELNAKVYLAKSRAEIYGSYKRCSVVIYKSGGIYPAIKTTISVLFCKWILLEFTNNSASYGGALFISDEKNSGSCNSKYKQVTSSECFFQQLALYSIYEGYNIKTLHLQNTHFTGNSATVYGDTIFGGLLDRCMLSSYSEITNKYQNLSLSSTNITFWLSHFTNLDKDDIRREISSAPVRICYCNKNKPDCNLLSPTYHVKKGVSIKISAVAVDQVNNSVPSNVSAILSSHDGGLAEDQAIQRTTTNCTELTYNLYSPHDSEQVILYADGPCKDTGISRSTITVKFLPCYCPTGFVSYTHPSNCICDCDPELFPNFIRNCSAANGTIERNGNVWINYVYATGKKTYVKHSHCPFDYCRPISAEKVWINLNVPNGADTQCAFNRSGKLCGSCEDGLSLSLGSSKCIPCSNNWLALLIVFAMAGVALVAFILVFNLTVAVGTINGLIFYANIIAAYRAIFLPFDKPNFLTIFIAWLNLDFGFEACFYNGMDAYAKTWLQHAFPLYIISLVVAIIVISDHSFKFAALFKGKDPIATLSTLILLSYTKLIRTMIASLSFTRLEYSDDSYEIVWLTDANVPYLKGKHIPLFITALLIVTIAMVYTLLLLGWQWINRCCPNIWITKNTKLNSFFDSYHNPYTYNKDHCYWIGLLLIVRMVLYSVLAVNVLGDPRINLLSINTGVGILFLLQVAVLQKQQIHKKTLCHALENISLANLIAFTSITFYITEERESQAVVAYISTAIAFTTFLAILLYHTCVFVLKRPFERVKSLYRVHQSRYQPLLAPEIADNNNDLDIELVGVTEIDGLPEAVDTTDDDQPQDLVTTDHYYEVEPANTDSDRDTKTCNNTKASRKSADIEVHSLTAPSKNEPTLNGPYDFPSFVVHDNADDCDEMMWGDALKAHLY